MSRRVFSDYALPAVIFAALAFVPKVGWDIPKLFDSPISQPGTLQLLGICLLFGGIALISQSGRMVTQSAPACGPSPSTPSPPPTTISAASRTPRDTNEVVVLIPEGSGIDLQRMK